MSVNIRLVSPVAQTLGAFYFAQVCKRGEFPLPGSVVCDTANYQTIVKKRWPDGSVKLVHVAGRKTVSASTNSPLFDNVPNTLVLSPGAPPAGTNLTAASIAAAAPTASVQCGTLGTIELGPLLATPFSTWLEGPEMVECRYRAQVGTTDIAVIFDVKMWLGGLIYILAYAENGYVDKEGGLRGDYATYFYVPTVTIGGVVVESNGGVARFHGPRTTWFARGWIGTPSQITPLHDPVYLMETKAFPNYGYVPNAGNLNSHITTYTLGSQGQWSALMSGGGYQAQIGLLPSWDAAAIASGDIRGRRSCIANSEMLRHYAIASRDKTTKLIVKPSEKPNWSMQGANGSGWTQIDVSGLQWDNAHHGSGGYAAYCLTGDQHHLDTMGMQSSTYWLMQSYGQGLGTSRRLNSQVRAIGWAMRTIGQYVAIAPSTDTVADEYRALLAYNCTYYANKTRTPGASSIGYPLNTDVYSDTQPATTAPWQYSFWTASVGHIWDADIGLANNTDFQVLRDYLYKSAVGILGANGAGNYCYTKATIYTITISSETIGRYTEMDADRMLPNWGAVFTATHGVPNTACGTALEGGLDNYGYWANLFGAISHAVDHQAPGAAASWARVTGASNWPTLRDSGFGNLTTWAVTPRAALVIEPPPPPPVSQATPGRSQRLETLAEMAARTLVGNSGLGLLGSAMASTGLHGPGYIFPQLNTTDDPTFEWSGVITREPVNGVLTTKENGEFDYLGTSDYFEVLLKKGGYALTDNSLNHGPGIYRVNLNVGVPADTVAPVMIGALTPSVITATGFILSWQSATDNVGVTGYQVSSDNGITYTAIGNVNSYQFSGLNAGTAYVCKVRARDAAGNFATPLVYSVTTLPAVENIPPQMTGAIDVSNITQFGFTLEWQAATDNISPIDKINYEASINGGATYEDLGAAGLEFNAVRTVNVVNLSSSTAYVIAIRAYDEAGNRSAPLATTVTTLISTGIYIPSPRPFPSPVRMSYFLSPKR